MNNEEKILAALEKLTGKVDTLTGTVEKQGGILAQHGELLAQIQEDQRQMSKEQEQMRDDITGIKLCLELDVEKRFDAVNEGIDTILERLTPKSRVDELESDVIVLKAAVKMLTQEVAELKKAQ